MKKCKVNVRTSKGIEVVEGYGFEVTLRDPETGKPTASVMMQAHKAIGGSGWVITCPCTGKAVATGRTRKDAECAYHNVHERYEAMYFTEEFAEMRSEFNAMVLERYGRRPLGEVVEAKVADKTGAEVKATVSNAGDGVTSITIEPRTVEVREAKPEPPREDDDIELVNTATTSALEMLRQFAEGKNLAVTQKNERCCIWVVGDTKAYKDELKEMGLRYSKKKEGWWLKVA